MKTTKGGKVMNPTDAYRKELRKKEIKRNKKERKKVRDVGILKKDPESIKEQIDKLEKMKADGALDKARKHKKRQLEDTLNMVMKKRKEYEEKMKEKGETPVMFSHLGPVRRPIAKEAHQPEDSVYYHPTLNPTGAPPPGKPPMYKSSLEPMASSEQDEAGPSAPPPPPPPPPPVSGELSSSSLPLPPPPPSPPAPPTDVQITIMPPPPPPPPAPPAQRPSQAGDGKNVDLEDANQKEPKQSTTISILLPPPPPLPPGLPPKPDSPTKLSKPILLPPPPPVPPHMLPPGVTRLPPPPPGPPPAHLLPSLPLPPPPPPGMPAYPLPPGPPPLARPGPYGPYVPQKPSYVKSAAPTVFKRPLAHHTPELTAMIPASVRVKRESVVPKGKSKAQISSSNSVLAPIPSYNTSSVKSSSSATSAGPKGQSIDESYMVFLEDMKELGALDG
ncbi:hypothetical protein LUZ60_010477 [Juncus effusus]|nr:hypothetical protein LUZ60_010477 [Juncus effusus]